MPYVPIAYKGLDGKMHRLNVQKKDDGYVPSPEYAPTAKVGICGRCKTMSVPVFTRGMDLAMGDRIMDGKTVQVTCMNRSKDPAKDCNGRTTDFVPAHLVPPSHPAYKYIQTAQSLLDEAVRMGMPVDEVLLQRIEDVLRGK